MAFLRSNLCIATLLNMGLGDLSVFENSVLFPRVDLNQPHDEIVHALQKAADAGGPGFFYLMNHGIDEAVFDEAIRNAHRFYSLPTREKLNNFDDAFAKGGAAAPTKGYVPPRAEGSYVKDASDVRPKAEQASGQRNMREAYVFRYPEVGTLKDAKYLSNYSQFLNELEQSDGTGEFSFRASSSRLSHPSNRVAHEDAVAAAAHRFFQNNTWPSPENLPNFRQALERYFGEMSNLSHRMFDLFLHAMVDGRGELEAMAKATTHDRGMVTFNMVRYPPTSKKSEDFGIVDHTDWEAFTLLYPSYLEAKHVDACTDLYASSSEECASLGAENPNVDPVTGIYLTGLEVWFQDRWLAVPRIPGAILVNQGEMLSRLSGGRFKAPVHRVLAQNPFERYSLVSFWAPNYEVAIPDPDLPCGKVLVGEHYLKRNHFL